MSQINQPSKPKNFVANIVSKKIYLENISSQMIEILNGMGAFQRPIGNNLVWLIECADEDVRIKALLELNQLGFIFVGGNSGYSAGDMFALLIEKCGLSVKLKEIWSHGPGDWFIIER